MNHKAGSKGTAVVTGASSGIGIVYAQRLAKQGYDLLLVARRLGRLAERSRQLSSRYRISANYLSADLTRTSDLERVMKVLAEDSTITALINNAGVATLSGFNDAELSKHQTMNALNMEALVRLSYAILPVFKRKNHGTLVNISSVLSLHAYPISSVYSGTKAYVSNFTRGLQEEVAGTNVRVQLVLPGATDTEIWDIAGVPASHLPVGTVMTAEDVVDAALSGLEQGETITMPSVEDIGLLQAYEAAREKLFRASQSARPASRYRIS